MVYLGLAAYVQLITADQCYQLTGREIKELLLCRNLVEQREQKPNEYYLYEQLTKTLLQSHVANQILKLVQV